MSWKEPQIKTDVPIPARAYDVKRERRMPPPRPSKWIAFLKKLNVGDSFIIYDNRKSALFKQAAKLEIVLYSEPFRRKKDRGTFELLSELRVWRVR